MHFVPFGNAVRYLFLVAWFPTLLTGLTAAETTADTGLPGWTFRNHVQPILARRGCNAGACHGALAGKGGFKLSLRGYDTERDWRTITRESLGRRIDLSDPEQSLLLAKPSGAIPHKGGLRLERDSLDYRVLAKWIAEGAPGPQSDDPRIVSITLEPASAKLTVAQKQPLKVLAKFDRGETCDVTQWARFTSTNDVVAGVSDNGEVTVTGSGVGAIIAWYQSQVALFRVTVPYTASVDDALFASAPQRNFIDQLVLKKLQELRLPPSPRSSDEVFLRRAYVDTIGVLPTPDEVRLFLADDTPEKRDRVIESLLDRKEFVDYWTFKWCDVLLVNGRRLRPKAVEAYYASIRHFVETNRPWDEFAQQVVTAQGDTDDNGLTGFFAVHQTAEDMSENICQAFLGLSIGCAKCHNHPLEKWTNDQYYAMANLFARVRAKGWGGDPRGGDGARTLYVASQGDLVQPNKGRPQPATPLDGTPLPFDDPSDRRVHLAHWLTAPENPYFSRAVTNRIWSNYFGVGLVEPTDDLRASNPASNEALLSRAATFLVEHGYDLKALMRAILQSETYQRSSQPLKENAQDHRFYSHYVARRMSAEVLHDAIAQVTHVPTAFVELSHPGMDREKIDTYPLGTRAIELHDAAVDAPFLQSFGRNPREITCECERSNQPSVIQAMHLINGTTVNDKLAAKESVVTSLVESSLSNTGIIEEAFLAVLSRHPTQREISEFASFLADGPQEERRQRLEDLYWSLITSREFMFHH